MEEKKQQDAPEQAAPQQAVSGDPVKDWQPALDSSADDRARAGHSGEGDRTDTDEMMRLQD
ncbi:MAG: hypothetical protein EOO11_22560 [Chitinophagaceae bacterium]|nr:MAG: hypothetical protein EOO11_22560 [Chitinophagaceae bacterium]